MKAKLLVLSAVAVLASQVAQASVYFDSANVGTANFGSDNAGFIAQSFYVAGTPDLSVTLDLSADTPTDGGSIMVYLVPDDGAAGLMNNAGNPLVTTDISGNVTGFDSSAVLVNTFADSSLAATAGGAPSAVTFNMPGSTLAGLNASGYNEYWIGIATAGSSGQWWFNGDGSGVGTDNQQFYNTYTTTNTGAFAGTGVQAYQMVIADAPEPATLAIIGAGLAGIGYVRRRKNTKA